VLKLSQDRHFGAARGTPGLPEGHQGGLPQPLLHIDGLSVVGLYVQLDQFRFRCDAVAVVEEPAYACAEDQADGKEHAEGFLPGAYGHEIRVRIRVEGGAAGVAGSSVRLGMP
jgi:hypothetical protein